MKTIGGVFLAVALLAPATGLAGGGLTVTVGESTVSADGKSLWKGDTVVFLTVSWPNRPWIPGLVTSLEMVEVTEGGSVTMSWPDEDGVPLRTLVVAANPRAGSYGLGSHPELDLETGVLPADALLVNEQTSRIDAIALTGRRVEYLVVRPGGGAWGIHALDGSVTDLDGVGDGDTVVALSSTIPNEMYGPPPVELIRGDLVFAVDCRSLGVLVGGV